MLWRSHTAPSNLPTTWLQWDQNSRRFCTENAMPLWSVNSLASCREVLANVLLIVHRQIVNWSTRDQQVVVNNLLNIPQQNPLFLSCIYEQGIFCDVVSKYLSAICWSRAEWSVICWVMMVLVVHISISISLAVIIGCYSDWPTRSCANNLWLDGCLSQ